MGIFNLVATAYVKQLFPGLRHLLLAVFHVISLLAGALRGLLGFGFLLYVSGVSLLLWMRGALAELCAERLQHTASISAAQIMSSDLPTSPCSRERRDGG